MLEKLTKKQEEMIPIVRQEWLDRFFKYDKTPQESIYTFVDYLYNLAGIKPPVKIILDSPLGIQV